MKYFKPIPNTPEATFAKLSNSHTYEFSVTVDDLYTLESTAPEEIIETVLGTEVDPNEADKWEIYIELIGPAEPRPHTDKFFRILSDKVMYEQSYRITLLPIAA